MKSESYDLLIKNGLLIDPYMEIHEKKDVAFYKGKVAAVESSLSTASAKKVVNASGKIVTPGLVDIHVHVFHKIGYLGVDPVLTCLRRGVTTAVDAGSAGSIIFPGFRKYLIDAAKMKLFAFLNVCSIGLVTYLSNIATELLRDVRFIDIDDSTKMIRNNKDVIVGVKWHHINGQEALLKARQLANNANCPLMAENSAYYWHSIDQVLHFLREGDILTHCFQPGPGGQILDEKGDLLPVVEKSMRNGVLLDVGHGVASFSFETAQRAIDQGIFPDLISTDLHSLNVKGPVFDLPTTMSKFLMLGIPLDEIIRRTTQIPAEVIGSVGLVGTLKAEAIADAVIWQLKEGKFGFEDCEEEKRSGKQKLFPLVIIQNGEIVNA